MLIWAVTIVKNEADIIGISVPHLFDQGIDHVLVADNMSTDGTRAILDQLSRSYSVTVVDDREPVHRQSEKMTRLANHAAAAGADWIVPFDADEIWRAYRGTVREAIERANAEILVAQMFDHYPRPTFRRGNVIERMPRNRTSEFAKVAYRWRAGVTIEDGNHNVLGTDAERRWGHLLIDHYPYRSWRQFHRKMREGAIAVRDSSVPLFVGAHWRRYGQMPEWRLRLAWWGLRYYPKLRRRARAQNEEVASVES